MALTIEQQYNLLEYLRWPADTLKEGTVYFNRGVKDIIDGLDSRPELEKRVIDKLNQILALDAQRERAAGRLKVTSIGRGEISLNNREIADIESLQHTITTEISNLIRLHPPSYYGFPY